MAEAPLSMEALRELVDQARRGDKPAADRLVRAHEAWVRSVIYGVTGRADLIDDIAQQVWSQAWERLDTLKDPERIRSWLYAIARNATIDQGQARKRRSMIGLDVVEGSHGDDGRLSPVRATIGRETREALLEAVEGLPALYREPFVLRHLEDWTYAEIGGLLGLPVETVETRLVRARRLLREALKGKLDS